MVHVTRYLYKPITIETSNERLEDVLQKISQIGNFYFSYSSSLIRKDSLINISVRNTPVKDILDRILNGHFEYRESSNYIILRPAFFRLSIIPETINSRDKMYFISGYISDEKTGAKIKNVSVYEKRLLKSTLTDKEGYFRLRFRGDYKSVILTASKENYRDTTVMFLSTVNINPQGYIDSAGGRGYGSSGVERRRFGRFLVSSRQRIQSLNIPDFLANTPFQASLTPGLSSHGMMSSQVVNKASLNVIGGYTAGVDGVEVAGVFNVNKKDVRYVQYAGITNMVGGSVTGVQVGGVMNTVLKDVTGAQLGGTINTVLGDVTGVQASGVLNTVLDSVRGVQLGGIINGVKGSLAGAQIAGVVNYVNKDFEGVQVSGTVNFTRYTFKGAQIGIANYVKNLKGVQVGLFNVADTSSGVSIGLFNWVNKGYHKISLSVNEVMNTNLAVKTGNSKLYTMYLGGINTSKTVETYALGIGFGHDFILNNKISIAAEISTRVVCQGNKEEFSSLNRLESNFQVKLFKPLTFFAGPSYNVYTSSSKFEDLAVKGFRDISPNYAKRFSGTSKGWWGWAFGLTLF
jgi:hypothetical protein